MKVIKNIVVYLLSTLSCFGLCISHSFAHTTNDSIVNSNPQQACEDSDDTLCEKLESTLFKLYELGYRQMPQGMQENPLAHNQGSLPFSFGEKGLGDEGFLSYYTLSENSFPEIIQAEKLVSMGNTTLDIQAHTICNINTNNNTNITDPITFALSIDPLAAKFPSMSPYNAMGNNPINCIDPDGKEIYFVAQGANGREVFSWGSEKGIQFRQDHIELELAYEIEAGKAYMDKYIGNTGHDIYVTYSDQFPSNVRGVTRNDKKYHDADASGKITELESTCFEAFEGMTLKSKGNDFALIVMKSVSTEPFRKAGDFLHELVAHVEGGLDAEHTALEEHNIFGEGAGSDLYSNAVNADGTPTPAKIILAQLNDLSLEYTAAEKVHDKAESAKRTQSLAEGVPYAKIPYTPKMFLDSRKSAPTE